MHSPMHAACAYCPLRWIHVDPCEAAFDRPLLYESGWGKALSYVFAIGTSGFVDVIRRYTRDKAAVQSRRVILPEADLASRLSELNTRIRTGLPQDLINHLVVRDLAEQLVRYLRPCSSPTMPSGQIILSSLTKLTQLITPEPPLILSSHPDPLLTPGATGVQLLRRPDARGARHPPREDHGRS